MNHATCDRLLETIADQLRSQFTVTRADHQYVVVTPMLYPDNTKISVAVEEYEGQRLVITDNGEAADYAFANGLGEPRIRDRIRTTTERFGLAPSNGGELEVHVPSSELAEGIFKLGTAIQDVVYLVYQRSPARSQRKFKENVESFLTLSGKSFTKDVSIPGRTGRKHFDYQVSGRGSQQLLLSIFESTTSSAAIQRAKVIAFDYRDIQASSDASSVPPLVVVMDDTNQQVRETYSDEVRAILESHVTKVIAWTNRDELDTVLVAA